MMFVVSIENLNGQQPRKTQKRQHYAHNEDGQPATLSMLAYIHIYILTMLECLWIWCQSDNPFG